LAANAEPLQAIVPNDLPFLQALNDTSCDVRDRHLLRLDPFSSNRLATNVPRFTAMQRNRGMNLSQLFQWNESTR
jgi:hypothetical protein